VFLEDLFGGELVSETPLEFDVFEANFTLLEKR
jgi:hypothetical protein